MIVKISFCLLLFLNSVFKFLKTIVHSYVKNWFFKVHLFFFVNMLNGAEFLECI